MSQHQDESTHTRPTVREILREAADTQHTAVLTWREARAVLDDLGQEKEHIGKSEFVVVQGCLRDPSNPLPTELGVKRRWDEGAAWVLADPDAVNIWDLLDYVNGSIAIADLLARNPRLARLSLHARPETTMPDQKTRPESVRIRVGKFVMRCGLRIAFGKRERYRDVKLSVGDWSEVDR